jgi:hypothetical protein
MPSLYDQETVYPGMTKLKLSRIANRRSKRQIEVQKPGPTTVYDCRGIGLTIDTQKLHPAFTEKLREVGDPRINKEVK